MALDGCRNAAALINKVRGFCGSTPKKFERVRLNATISEVIDQLSTGIGSRASIRFEPCPDDIAIMGDPGQLGQAIVSIIVNAALALPEGGDIEVRVYREILREGLSEKGAQKIQNYGVISVQDRGVGMNSELLNRIFDPFYTTARDGKVYGKGLGLTLAYGIARSHKGWIDVESAEGKGSLFRLYFPEAA